MKWLMILILINTKGAGFRFYLVSRHPIPCFGIYFFLSPSCGARGHYFSWPSTRVPRFDNFHEIFFCTISVSKQLLHICLIFSVKILSIPSHFLYRDDVASIWQMRKHIPIQINVFIWYYFHVTLGIILHCISFTHLVYNSNHLHLPIFLHL